MYIYISTYSFNSSSKTTGKAPNASPASWASPAKQRATDDRKVLNKNSTIYYYYPDIIFRGDKTTRRLRISLLPPDIFVHFYIKKYNSVPFYFIFFHIPFY